MALRKDFVLNGNAILNGDDFRVSLGEQSHVISDAYIKVESVTGTKNDAVARISIVSDDSRLEREIAFVPNMDGANFIAQAYLHLKTLPEFADATDC